MRLFVCEFITCGGMRGQHVPKSLLADAETMFQALLADLREIDGIDIATTRDARLAAVPESVATVGPGDDAWGIWKKQMQTSDAVWAIAPEAEGALLKMHHMARDSGALSIGCGAEAIEITASKRKTAVHLSASGIACIDTFPPDQALPDSDSGWIVKPDAGAGTEDCYYFAKADQFYNWRESVLNLQGFIVQPYLSGVAASLSVLYQAGQATLLSCNEQKFRIENGVGHQHGVIVNGLKQSHAQFEPLAVKIGQAIPGLLAYVGIDLILGEAGPVVVEVNPRLTTSYAGLRRSLGINVAEKILGTFQGRSPVMDSRLPVASIDDALIIDMSIS